ncbi:DUF4299 family protein [Streptococcus panodentis]|uniref:DUF4299 domain-containing protein n=1 Tax=Streptococcus panodentis TaxID=1581472 RepID=A0ABS5AY10_9STRE|nr:MULTISPECIES: DUF4299 family protein [Streptococcus]KXT84819.1 hypothetical protein STRDD11_00755 [Streptococcus sp. DD11]MBP2621420.1 DUF4299 domain-containing protein [Streptococcus panodentis]
MSISFYVQNRKGLFGYKGVETPLSLVSMVEGLETFGLQGRQGYQSLEHLGLFLAVYQESAGRGFEIAYLKERETYQIRLLTPSTVGDWKGAILFLSRLAQKMKNDIVDEVGRTYTADGIFNLDFEADILYGLSHLKELDVAMHCFPGYAHDLYLTHEKALELLEADDPVEEFGRLLAEMQQVPSYFAKPKYYRDQSGAYLGSYVLTEGVDIVIPTDPVPDSYAAQEINRTSSFKEIDWKLNIVVEDASSPEGYKYLTTTDLKDFLARIPEQRYVYLDSSQIRIQPLSRPEIEQILAELPAKKGL